MSYIGMINSFGQEGTWKGGRESIAFARLTAEVRGEIPENRFKQILLNLDEIPGGAATKMQPDGTVSYKGVPFWVQHRALNWEQPLRVRAVNAALDGGFHSYKVGVCVDRGAVWWKDHPTNRHVEYRPWEKIWLESMEKILAPANVWDNIEEYIKEKPLIAMDIGINDDQESGVIHQEESMSDTWKLDLADAEGNTLEVELQYASLNFDYVATTTQVWDATAGAMVQRHTYDTVRYPFLHMTTEMQLVDPTSITTPEQFKAVMDGILTDDVMESIREEAMEESLGGVRTSMEKDVLLDALEHLNPPERMNFLNSEGPKASFANLISSLVAQPGWQGNVQGGDDGENPGEGPGGDGKRGKKRPRDS